jgi:hypothetical protein
MKPIKNLSIVSIFLVSMLIAHYQDIVINGITLEEGSYECPRRYAAMKYVFNRYARPFTVLDLGASEGYFSFALARDYGAVCVMVEGNYADSSEEVTADRLHELCKENTDLSTCILLKKYITLAELAQLGGCTYFDVVLALNFVNHFGARWQVALEAIRALGSTVIIESPCADNKDGATRAQLNAIHAYLLAHNAQVIDHVYYKHTTKTKASTLYCLENREKKLLTHLNLYRPLPHFLRGTLTLESDFKAQILRYQDRDHSIEQEWPRGINLLVYKMLNGVFPFGTCNAHLLPDIPQDYVVQGAVLVRAPQLLNKLATLQER